MIAERECDAGVVELGFNTQSNQYTIKYSDGHVQYVDKDRGENVMKMLRMLTKQSLNRVTRVEIPRKN